MISLELSGAIASIRLDRAATRNALGAEGWRALAEAIAAAGRSQARVLVLGSANQSAFCSGSDLGELESLVGDAAARPPFRAMMRAAIDALPGLDIPVIAAIDGACFGAGAALALGCDIRVAGAAARFAITPAKLGISFPPEDVARLVSAVGTGQAARLLFTAEPIDAAEAARIGLVDEVCPAAAPRALAMAEAIAANSGASLALLKAMLQQRASRDESDRDFDACFADSDFAERLRRFRGRGRSRD
jgi:enoyl-CoA hydratase/carnithine racemase